MSTNDNRGLDEEERALAAQLARIAPRGEPSAQLDARILAMAGTGAIPSPAESARRRPRRWPVWMGLAASLTVVAGLAWRLEPLLHPRQPVRYQSPAPVAADTDAGATRAHVEYVSAEAASSPPPPPPAVAAPTPAASRTPAREPVPVADAGPPVAPEPRSPPAADAEADAMADAATEADAAAASAQATARRSDADRNRVQEMPRQPAPVVAAPPEKAARSTAPALVIDRGAGQSQSATAAMRAAAAPAAPAAPPAPPPAAEREGFDARPPATADAPEVRQAWLARIRELYEAGESIQARASLKAFVQRYPKAEIPADLKPLLPSGPPAPSQ